VASAPYLAVLLLAANLVELRLFVPMVLLVLVQPEARSAKDESGLGHSQAT
jgi:hypothetical protein